MYMNALLKHETAMAWETGVHCWKTFGPGKKMLASLFFKPNLFLINHFSLLLDQLLFSQLKNIHVERPVFITGHPRSGTTFLHRVLTQTGEFACFEFWHTLSPSLITRYALSPVERLLRKMGKSDILVKDSGHYTSLNSIEEEEFLLMGCYNSPLSMLFTSLAFGNNDYWDIFHFEKQPVSLKNETICYLKACFKRQIYYLERKQIIAKMPYAMLRYPSLLQAFPDAKFIYLIRSPHEVVPSYLSLIRAILDRYWKLDNLPLSIQKDVYNRVYQQSIKYYEWVERLEKTGILNPGQFLVLPYHQLKTDLTGVLKHILEFTGIHISDKLRNTISEQAARQNSYHREHQNMSLEDFGFSTDKMTQDFGFVTERYRYSEK